MVRGRLPEREGVIVGWSKDNTLVRVKFDGTKHPRAFHPKFIRRTEATAENP
jgi:hypothetical protein